MKLAVIGSGYVGLVAAACFAEIGHHVICVDNEAEKVSALSDGQCLIHEAHLPELLQRHRGKRLRFTTSLHDAVRASEIIFIAVGTPPCETGEADVSFIECVCDDIAREINGHGPKTIVVKSTVPAGTNAWIRRVLIRNGVDPATFELAANPEFLRESTAVTDFLYPDRIIIGSNSPRATEQLRAVYAPLTNDSYRKSSNPVSIPSGCATAAQLIVTSPASAELIKQASNAFLAIKISFVNAMANLCEATGADIDELVCGIGSDRRIGHSFLRPGIGYGGSCFPKDISALHAVAEQRGHNFQLLAEVRRINDEQRNVFVRKMRNTLWTLKGKRLAVLGLAFKGGTDDIRESPAIAIVRALLREECEIQAYDPAAMDRARDEFATTDAIQFVASAYEAAQGADALVILAEWEEFRAIDFDRLRELLHRPTIFDGRNLLDPERMRSLGFLYLGVGRSEALPVTKNEVGTAKDA